MYDTLGSHLHGDTSRPVVLKSLVEGIGWLVFYFPVSPYIGKGNRQKMI